MDNKKEVYIEKADNGYIVRIRYSDKQEYEDLMLRFFQMGGMYEKYEEHKEEELRRLIRVIRPPIYEEKTYIFSTLDEVVDFLKKFVGTSAEEMI